MSNNDLKSALSTIEKLVSKQFPLYQAGMSRFAEVYAFSLYGTVMLTYNRNRKAYTVKQIWGNTAFPGGESDDLSVAVALFAVALTENNQLSAERRVSEG